MKRPPAIEGYGRSGCANLSRQPARWRNSPQACKESDPQPSLQGEKPSTPRSGIYNNLLFLQIAEIITADVERGTGNIGDLQFVGTRQKLPDRKACQPRPPNTPFRLIQNQRPVFILKLPKKGGG